MLRQSQARIDDGLAAVVQDLRSVATCDDGADVGRKLADVH